MEFFSNLFGLNEQPKIDPEVQFNWILENPQLLQIGKKLIKSYNYRLDWILDKDYELSPITSMKLAELTVKGYIKDLLGEKFGIAAAIVTESFSAEVLVKALVVLFEEKGREQIEKYYGTEPKPDYDTLCEELQWLLEKSQLIFLAEKDSKFEDYDFEWLFNEECDDFNDIETFNLNTSLCYGNSTPLLVEHYGIGNISPLIIEEATDRFKAEFTIKAYVTLFEEIGKLYLKNRF